MESKRSLTFSFCGEYEVNALSLSNAINSLVELSTAIAESEFPSVEFRLSVKAVTPGSLKFDFVATALAASQFLLAPGTIEYAANLIAVITAAFSIKKFLNGKRPKEVQKNDDKIVITNADGAKLEAPANAGVYFIDNRVDQSITSIINCAKLSDGVSGISIAADEKVDIQRSEFDICSNEIEMNTTCDSISSTRYNEVLFIRQPDFTGELKWRFKGDQNITATVEDTEFIEKVKSGLVVSSRTYIIADLEVKMNLGPDGTPDNSRPTYIVKKVHSIHTSGEEQTQLDT